MALQSSRFGVFPELVWERVMELSHCDKAYIRLSSLNRAFAGAAKRLARRRFRHGLSLRLYTFPNAALARDCPGQRRKGATVSLNGNLLHGEDVPGALRSILSLAKPTRLSLSSLHEPQQLGSMGLARPEQAHLHGLIVETMEILGASEASSGFTQVELLGVFGSEEFAAQQAARAGDGLKSLAFVFTYSQGALEMLPPALCEATGLERLSLREEGTHEEEFMENHCLRPLLRELPSSLVTLDLSGSVGSALVNLSDLAVLDPATRLTRLHLPKAYQFGPLLMDYRTSSSKLLSCLEYLEAPICHGFLSGSETNVQMFELLPLLSTFVNTNGFDGSEEIARVLADALEFHHSKDEVRTLRLQWPTVAEMIDSNYVFSRIFSDFHPTVAPFSAIKVEPSTKGEWGLEAASFESVLVFRCHRLTVVACLNAVYNDFPRFI